MRIWAKKSTPGGTHLLLVEFDCRLKRCRPVKEIDYYGIEDEATYHVPKDEWISFEPDSPAGHMYDAGCFLKSP